MYLCGVKQSNWDNIMPENNVKDREQRRAEVINMITSSREKAIESLTRAGILDSTGQLAEVYR